MLLSYLKVASPSYQSTLRVLLSYLKVAIFEPELPEHTSRILLSYSKIAIFEPKLPEYTSRATCVLESCDFRAEAARVS